MSNWSISLSGTGALLLLRPVGTSYSRPLAGVHGVRRKSAMEDEDREGFWPPKSHAWVPIGAAVGLAAGAIFGWAYALAGLFIGLVAGTTIWLSLR
jgi:hypothetical protein